MSNGQGLSEPACRKGLPSLPPRTPFSAPEQHSSQPHTQGGLPRLVTTRAMGPRVTQMAQRMHGASVQAASTARGPLGGDKATSACRMAAAPLQGHPL